MLEDSRDSGHVLVIPNLLYHIVVAESDATSQLKNTHSRPYPCEKCNYTFGLGTDLKRHVLARHRVGLSKYPCIASGCEFKATRKDNVRQHVRKSHPDHHLAPLARRDGRRPQSATNSPSVTNASIPAQPLCSPSILMQAASTGNMGFFEVLMRLGADLSSRADDGSTVLHCAVKTGQIGMTEYLLTHVALKEALNQKKRSPLHEAVINQDHAVAKILTEHGAMLSKSMIDDIVKLGSLRIFQDVLHLIGDAISGDEGKYIFGRASEWEQIPILQFFIQSPLIDRHWVSANYSNMLYDALIRGRSTPFRCLRACGKLDPNMIKLDSRLHEEYKTILLIVAMRGQVDILQIFLQCSDCDSNATDRHGYTPLERAAENGRTTVVELLLGDPRTLVNGSDIVRLKSGASVLHIVVKKGHIDIAKLLLEHPRLDFNPKDVHGQTPLEYVLLGRWQVNMFVLFLTYEQVQISIPACARSPIIRMANQSGNGKMIKQLMFSVRVRPAYTYEIDSLSRSAVLGLHWDLIEGLFDPAIEAPHHWFQLSADEERKARERTLLGAVLKGNIWVDKSRLLHRMVKGSHFHLFDMILQGEFFDPNAVIQYPSTRHTVLHHAVLYSNLEAIRILLDHERVDINALTLHRRKSCHCAAGCT